MGLDQIYKVLANQQDCISFLEKILWNGKPICPYCKTSFYSSIPKERRYHCNKCNTSFSILVGTIFENTKLDLQKWLYAFSLTYHSNRGISARFLAQKIRVTKDTAWLLQNKIRMSITDYHELIKAIDLL